jgi:hypothetical protein
MELIRAFVTKPNTTLALLSAETNKRVRHTKQLIPCKQTNPLFCLNFTRRASIVYIGVLAAAATAAAAAADAASAAAR